MQRFVREKWSKMGYRFARFLERFKIGLSNKGNKYSEGPTMGQHVLRYVSKIVSDSEGSKYFKGTTMGRHVIRYVLR